VERQDATGRADEKNEDTQPPEGARGKEVATQPKAVTRETIHNEPVGAPLDIINVSPDAPAPKQLPPQVEEAVRPVIDTIKDRAPTSDQARLGEPMDAATFVATNVALQQPAPERLAYVAPGAEDSGIVVDLSEPRPEEIQRIAAENSAEVPRPRFTEVLRDTTVDSVMAEFEAVKSDFSTALDQTNPREILDRVGSVTPDEFFDSLAGDKMWYHNLYVAAGTAGWRSDIAEIQRQRNEGKRIAEMTAEYDEAVKDGLDPESLTLLLKGYVNESNRMDIETLKHAYKSMNQDVRFRGEYPKPVSPLAAVRMRNYMGMAYGQLKRISNQRAEQEVLERSSELYDMEGNARRVDGFVRDPYSAQQGRGSDKPSEDYLRSMAQTTALQVSYLYQYGERPEIEASEALLGAYGEVQAEYVRKWQSAERADNPHTLLVNGELPTLPPGHFDRSKEIALINYSLMLRYSVEDHPITVEEADNILLEDLHQIIDEQARERSRLTYEEDRSKWLRGNRPGPSDADMQAVADYTAVMLQTKLRYGNAQDAGMALQDMLDLVAEAEIQALQANQYAQDPEPMHAGILPEMTAEKLQVIIDRAQQAIPHILQIAGRGAAKRYIAEWMTSTRKMLEGERLVQEFNHNPEQFLRGENPAGFTPEDLRSLPDEVLEVLLEDTAREINKLGQKGTAANEDSPLYEWLTIINGTVQARAKDQTGVMKQDQREAAWAVAQNTMLQLAATPEARNRVNVISDRRHHPDNYAVAAATSPNVPTVTTLGNYVAPDVAQAIEWAEQQRGHAVRVRHGQGDISPTATARINILSGPAPLNIDGRILLEGMAPGDVTFYRQNENPELDQEIQTLLKDQKYNWQYTMRVSNTALITLEPFSYNADPTARTAMLFRDELYGQPNFVLQRLIRLSQNLARINARRRQG
jgi:hypothetical protein